MYTFDGRIRYSEVGPDRVLTLESLIDYFQDCSTFQSEDLGIGLDYMRQQGVAWFVNYWQIEIRRLPRLGEQVRSGTSPYALKGCMGLRNFLLETAEGEELAIANSVWSLIDVGKMWPVRVEGPLADRYTLGERFEMEYLPRHIRLPKGEGLTPTEGETIHVQPYHLDTNHHMNNGQYVRLALQAAPDQERIRRLRIEYKKQARLGDQIRTIWYDTDESTRLILLCDAQEDPYAIVQVCC